MISLMNATIFEVFSIWVVLGISLIGLAYALLLRGQIMKMDKGTPKMQEVWNAIRLGANAYLGRQLKVITPIIILLTIALFFSVYVVPPSHQAVERFSDFPPDKVRLIIGLGRAIAFVM